MPKALKYLLILTLLGVLGFISACSKDAGDTTKVTNTTTSNTQTVEKAEDDEDTGAAFPETDIYLARMLYRSGSVSFSQPENITSRSGYDNQPFFMPDNETILFTSRHNLDQTDIFSYSISSRQIQQLTDTPESEYSPTLTPNDKFASVVRVEMDGTQRLWEFSINEPLVGVVANNEVFEVVFPEVSGVGYHGWTDEDSAYLFIVDALGGDNHQLAKASKVASGAVGITRKIGRSIVMIPDSPNISYIAKDNPDSWFVMELDEKTGQSKVLTQTVPMSEDLVWLDASNLIMAGGNKIYHNNLANNEWISISENALSDIEGNITRLAVSPNKEWLAFVVTQSN